MTVPLLLACALVAAGAGLLAWARRNLLLVRVSGESMYPAYRQGDKVLVRRVTADRVRPGDVALAGVSPATERQAMTRLLGRFPGEERRGPGAALTRGGPDAVLAQEGRPAGPGSPANWMIKRVAAVPGDPLPASVPPRADETTVPEGCLVLLGDNAGRSLDSRHFGYVPAADLIGKVIRTVSAGGR